MQKKINLYNIVITEIIILIISYPFYYLLTNIPFLVFFISAPFIITNILINLFLVFFYLFKKNKLNLWYILPFFSLILSISNFLLVSYLFDKADTNTGISIFEQLVFIFLLMNTITFTAFNTISFFQKNLKSIQT
jgi:hypothetical protein